MKILTAEQMRGADRLTTERYGIPSLQLMENAGASVAEFLRREVADLSRSYLVVLCGKGNNGGDGFVAARHLREMGAQVTVIVCAKPDALAGDAAAKFQELQRGAARILFAPDETTWSAVRQELQNADLLVDALLGTGLSGAVKGLLARVIEDLNQHGPDVRVLAVDTPSGLPSDASVAGGPVVRADWTVSFTAPKVGQLFSPQADHVGHLVVRSIGTPRELFDADPSLTLTWLEPCEFRSLSLRRRADSHKGTYGHALIVAGSRGKAGAAGLAGWAALRAGVGLATVGTPHDALPVVASYLPELMTAPLEQTDAGSVSLLNFDNNRFANLCSEKSVLAMGPGLGLHPETQQFVRSVVKNNPLPMILDADGLNALAAASEPIVDRKGPALVLTPHPGEMARLLGSTTAEVQKDRLRAALRGAARYHAIAVLKGFHSIVAVPDGRAFVNSTGNPGMATAGTGDVLTGMLAGLTAQFGIEHWERLVGMGVYLHGLAGDLAAQRFGQSPMTASDLIGAIPAAFAQLIHDWERCR
jgi:ADP-dependent NAD(P)H-hydrate dehydratase / NAD(P)H-hydrate epimerase